MCGLTSVSVQALYRTPQTHHDKPFAAQTAVPAVSLTACSLTQMKTDIIVYSRKNKITVKSFMNHLILLLPCPYSPPSPESTQQWYEYEASELLPLQSELEPFITILLPHCRGQETQRPTEREREALQSVTQVRPLSSVIC